MSYRKGKVPQHYQKFQIETGRIFDIHGSAGLMQVDHYAGEGSGSSAYYTCTWTCRQFSEAELARFVLWQHCVLAERWGLDELRLIFGVYAQVEGNVFHRRFHANPPDFEKPTGGREKSWPAELRFRDEPEYLRLDGDLFGASVERDGSVHHNVPSDCSVVSFSSYFSIPEVAHAAYELSKVGFNLSLVEPSRLEWKSVRDSLSVALAPYPEPKSIRPRSAERPSRVQLRLFAKSKLTGRGLTSRYRDTEKQTKKKRQDRTHTDVFPRGS